MTLNKDGTPTSPQRYDGMFNVYLCDTFADEIFLLETFSTLTSAKEYVSNRFGDRIDSLGDDRVEIKDPNGMIIAWYNIMVPRLNGRNI